MNPILNNTIFGGINFQDIDYKKNTRFVIERVINKGDLQDFRELLKYYGFNRVKEDIKQIRSMDKLTFNFCQSFFKIEKEDFRCYNLEPSIRQLCSYYKS